MQNTCTIKLITEEAGRLDAKTLVIQPAGDIPAELTLPADVRCEKRAGGALALSYHRSRTTAEDVLDAVRAAGIRIEDVASEDPRLEDIFLALTSSSNDAGRAA